MHANFVEHRKKERIIYYRVFINSLFIILLDNRLIKVYRIAMHSARERKADI